MKKILFLATLAATILLTACQKDAPLTDDELIDQIAAASKIEIPAADVPATASTYVAENYFETYLEEAALAEGKGYQLTLGDESRVYCDRNGRVLRSRRPNHHHGPCGRGAAVAASDLPAAITSYVADNYPGANIQRAKQLLSGTYFVKIDTPGYILIFDGEGVFIEATVIFYHCRPLGTPVDVATLPAAVTDYIAANFTNAEIKVAFEKNNGMLIVGIFSEEGRKIVGFDADGNFLFVRP